MKPIIKVENLSKQYRIGARQTSHPTLRDSIANVLRASFSHSHRNGDSDNSFWALKDVSFDVMPGEVVGVIGRNGAGKSTLLKILSRITEPTEGQVDLYGRVSSLLEVGTGFHIELSGRENIYLNGAILGMRRSEIDRKFDEIVAFAEIDKFIDTPVKHYSSGMYMRLAFAVAAHLEPEVMIVDEVLAVGDAAFQKKCLGKMGEIGREGRTILFVSHNMHAVQDLCSRVILLTQGRVVFDGDTLEALQIYSKPALSNVKNNSDLRRHIGRTQNSTQTMVEAIIAPASGSSSSGILMGDSIVIKVSFESESSLTDIDFGFIVKDKFGVPILGVNNKSLPCDNKNKTYKRGTVTGLIEKLPLMPGFYTVDLFFGAGGADFDTVIDALNFEVSPFDVFGTGILPSRSGGPVFIPAKWEVAKLAS
jgi:lipopolysaccharide transport system ATP-binding protein